MIDHGPDAEAAPATEPGRATRHVVLTLVVAVLWVALDQLTKTLAVRHLDEGVPVHVVWTLQWNLTFNSGMAFSQGRGLGPVISVVALVVVVVLLLSFRRSGSRLAAIAVGMVVGGAIGNVLDRVFRTGDGFLGGHVVDVIDFQWWPVFNVADIGVVVGGLLLVLGALRGDRAVGA